MYKSNDCWHGDAVFSTVASQHKGPRFDPGSHADLVMQVKSKVWGVSQLLKCSVILVLVPSPIVNWEDWVRKGIRRETCAKSNMDDPLWRPLIGSAKKKEKEDIEIKLKCSIPFTDTMTSIALNVKVWILLKIKLPDWIILRDHTHSDYTCSNKKKSLSL